MDHFIYQDNDFNLIERIWDYDTNTVTCHISKDSVSFSELEDLFSPGDIIPEFTFEFNEGGAESPMDYTVISCQEQESYYELVFQYKIPVPIQVEQLTANLDYLATMLDIDLEE